MSLNLSDAQVKYTDHLKSNGKAKATVLAYSKDIEQLAKYLKKQGKILTDEINYEDVNQYKELLKKRRYAIKTIARKVNSIKSFFRYLEGEGVIKESPAEEVTHPKVEEKSPRFLTKLEYRALRDACRGDVRMGAIIELLLQTGIRISELANLKMDDLDLERDVVYIRAQKTRDARRVPLNNPGKEALMDYLKIRPKAKEKSLFLTKTCNPFLVRNIRTAIDRYFRLAGINDAKVNDLRSTFIVEQLRAGTPLVYVSQLVGHKRITTTEKYLNLVEDQIEAGPNVQIEAL